MIGYPPLFAGAVQERSILVGDVAVAVRPVGAPGATAADDDAGVTDTSPDAVLVPIEFIAEIL